MTMSELMVMDGAMTTSTVATKERLELEVYVDGMYTRTMDGYMIIEAYLSSLKSPHTARLYKRSIYEFFEFIYPHQALTAWMLVLDPIHAMAYREEISKDLKSGKIKSATFNAKIKGCKQFYDWLMGQTTLNTSNLKLFNINPFDKVKQVAENDSEGSEPLTAEEVLLMIDNPMGESEHLKTRNRLLLEIAISTGIRNDALIGMTKDDIINVCGDWIINTIDKWNKDTMKPINNYYDELMKWYEEDLKLRGLDNNGTIFNIHPQSANRLVREWAKKLGINKKITFHSLRTTTAVQVYHLYDDNLGRAKAICQHSHIETTAIYLAKENVVNHDAEDIVKIMKGAKNDFEDIIKGMDKEELVNLILSLDTSTKMQIMKNLK